MSIKKDFFAPLALGLGATRRAAMMLLVMMLTATTAWAGTVDVTVNVTGSGSVSIGNQTATAGNPFTTSVDDGASVTLTFAPDADNIVTSAKLSYKPSEYVTAEEDIAISGSTATFQMPNDIWNGTGVTINVTFGDGLAGGADEASAVALTDATVSNLAGGYYKVESDISFDHTLNLIGNTYLVIASGAKMTVSSSEYGINGELYALNVLGEGTLNVTTTGSYKIAVCVSSYTQSGCSVNLTTTYIGMRCSDSFNISGGSFKTNGSTGIWPDNAVNISGGKLEVSNIDANINLSYSSTDDYIKVDTYTNGNTMTIANGQTFTDGTTNYSGTIENLSALNGKKLFPFVYTHLTVRAATCTEVGIKQECWQRSSDGKYFSDENGTNELNASDVEIPMIAHNGIPHEATDTHIAYWQCSMCSKYFSEEGCTTEITEEDTKIYRTITIDGSISGLVTSNVDKAVAGTTVTLTVSHLIDASTLRVNGGSVALTDAGNGTYTFTVPAADVTVTASTATTYSVNLPANMEIVSATTTADGDGKYISGTVVTFKASFSYTASNVSDGANTLTADGSGNYSVTVGTADITVTATIGHSSNIDLSQAPSDFTVVDGDVLTGSTSHTVTIANNAKITLSNATITGGIVCSGTATITLVGTNSVTGATQKAGIQIGGSVTTLTIRGNGSLTANGQQHSAGIGLSRAWDVTEDVVGGNIVINGGTITANGGSGGAGIGAGVTKDKINSSSRKAIVGNITITGGTVTAVGGSNADGIGAGQNDYDATIQIGTVTIYDDIDKVDASKITESVTYMHDDTDVTASASTYFTIIEDGDRRIIEKKDDTDYSITITDNTEHGTIECAATTAKYGEKVTITATSDFGYRFDHLIVKDADNNDVSSTGNSFFMPKSNVTVSAVFEQGTHGTTEFAWGYIGDYYNPFTLEATIYDGVTTVNLQQGKEYNIGKDYYEDEPGMGYCDNTFRLDEDPYAEGRDIPYSGGTGSFMEGGYGNFRLNGDAGFYDITMTDVGNGKWNVSILKTAGQMDVVPDQTYTGSAITPEPLVIAGSLSLTKGTDYVYSYENNTNVGTATVRATFQGTYASLGYVEKTFTIVFAPSDWADNGDGSYTIGSTLGWSIFCDCLDDNDTWNGFSGKTVKLGGDIGTAQDPITRMAGSDKHDFCGTFDGQGHTLNVNLNGAQYVAPFFYVKSQDNDHPATIQNLKVSGTVTGSDKFAAGIAGGCANVVNITNCLVDVTINSSVNGDGTHGGLVGVFDGGTLNITGCAFTGKLLSIGSGATTKCGGFVGYSHVNGTDVNITNSLYAPAALVGSETEPTGESMTFLRSSTNTTVTITNSYYTRTLGDAQGKQAHSITAGENVTISAISPVGDATATYSVSGITAYAKGITRTVNETTTFYYGEGDDVSLTLSNTAGEAPLGYSYGYTASAGTLSGSTLTMPDQDVTVSVNTAVLTVLPWSGDGSKGNPYIIYNKDQLDLLAYRVNGTHGETRQENGYSGAYFQLNNDISYTHKADGEAGAATESNYEAIGGYYDGNDRYFCGHFDGNNKTISGIRIYKGGSLDTSMNQGIFGRTASGADIHDLTLADARITGYNSTGGIVGYNNGGTVTRCHVAADVAVCAVQSYTYYHGGIVGNNYRGTIEQCTSAANLTTAADADNSQNYGGIAGYNSNYGTLRDNLAIGATVPAAADNTYGAITGLNSGTLQRNYYAACKVANTPNATNVGCNNADVTADNGAVSVHTLTLADGITIAGGTTAFTIPAHGETAEVTYYIVAAGANVTLSYSGTIGDGYQLGIVSNDGICSNAATADGSGNYTAVMPAADATAKVTAIPWSGDGSKDEPYLIEYTSQLDLLAYRVNGTHDETRQEDGYSGAYFQLAKDISYTHKADGEEGAATESNYEAIGGYYGDDFRSFCGHFDGNNKTISGIRIYKDGDDYADLYQGIFGRTGDGADIHDLTLADARITGHDYTGGIVGYNEGGTVTRCHVAGDVAVCAVQSGAWWHGGIVGDNDGTIKQCTSAATLTIADADADNSYYYGGIAGRNNSGTLRDNLAIGATVPAAADNFYGAITGYNGGTLLRNYYAACKVADTENATGVGCGYIDDGNGGHTTADVTDDNGAVPALRDNADNSTAIGLFADLASTADGHVPVDLGWGAGKYPMQLAGRTLFKDGKWNTLCLPFALSAEQIAAHTDFSGATLMELNTDGTNGFDPTDGTLYLTFKEATAIAAGVPYLVKWDAAGTDFTSPVFSGVTIDATASTTVSDADEGLQEVQMVGCYSPVPVEANDKSILFLGEANTLYYSSIDRDIRSCRAYFSVPYIKEHAGTKARAFRLDFGDGEQTGIMTVQGEGFTVNGSDAWYTLDGRKLDGKPATKGLYINGGKKVAIK